MKHASRRGPDPWSATRQRPGGSESAGLPPPRHRLLASPGRRRADSGSAHMTSTTAPYLAARGTVGGKDVLRAVGTAGSITSASNGLRGGCARTSGEQRRVRWEHAVERGQVELLVALGKFVVAVVRGADGGAGTLVGMVGQAQGFLGGTDLNDAMCAGAVRSWGRPGSARQNHSGVPSSRPTTWTFMSCLP